VSGLTDVRADDLAALEIFAGCPTEALVPLAAELRPLTAAAGQVLMQQGELAVSFLIIGYGRAEVTHTGIDGHDTVAELKPGLIAGEIALLRNGPRTATVIAKEALTGWVGGRDAFAAMLEDFHAEIHDPNARGESLREAEACCRLVEWGYQSSARGGVRCALDEPLPGAPPSSDGGAGV